MAERQIVSRAWRGLDVPSTEHLELDEGDVVRIASRVVRGDVSFEYTVELGSDWTFRALRVARADGLSLEVARDEGGRWTVEGSVRDDLSPAVDIDLLVTPFTNTLPLRRLDIPVGGSVDLVTAWVDAELEVYPDSQRYTRLDGSLYRFESDGGAFMSELAVDPDGFVVDYPGLFVALDPAAE